MIKELKGVWLIEDTHTDIETNFLITETNRFQGTLAEAIEDTIHHKNTQQLRFSFYEQSPST